VPDVVGLFTQGNAMGLGLGVDRIDQIEQKVSPKVLGEVPCQPVTG